MDVPSHLKSLQALDVALRTGSFTAAAEVLAITPAAVGQRVKALETYLGFELLVRGRSSLRPTPELVAAIEPLAAAFDKLNAVGQILDFQRVNEIHVAANPDFVDLWLQPRLPRFKASHPHILFCVNGAGDVPLRLGPADCEISFGKPRTDGGSDFLFGDFLVPIGSVENTDRILHVAGSDKLEGFPLLHLDFYKDDPKAIGWPEWIGMHGYRQTALGRGIRYQRIAHALDAVLSSAGFMICGVALLSQLIGRRDISFPFPLSTGAWTGHAYRASFRAGAVVKPQVKRFREWLIDESRTTQTWLDEFIARA
ncbi:MAG: LysR family transcriptional regulator [Gammaproteobacteria bacterium]|nr:LysR family transcriptional regulator [Gammaproteobacteria bacterium]